MHLLYNQHLFDFPISHLLWPGSFIFHILCALSRLKRQLKFFSLSSLIFLYSLNDHHYTPACLFYRSSIYHLLFWRSLWSKFCFDLYYMYSCCTVLVAVSWFSEEFNYKSGLPMISMMNRHVRRQGHAYLKRNITQDLKTYCFTSNAAMQVLKVYFCQKKISKMRQKKKVKKKKKVSTIT